MITVKLNVNLKEVRDKVEGGLGLSLTKKELMEIVPTNVWAEIDRWGIHDTLAASKLCSSISSALIGREVPTYGDGPEVAEQFWKDLHEAARKKGYKTLGN